MDQQIIRDMVAYSLREDLGPSDLTANLISQDRSVQAVIISREPGVLCGVSWAQEVYRQLDEAITLQWHKQDGDPLIPGECIVQISGNARNLLTGERCALNWLQTLSGTATIVAQYVAALQGFTTKLLDTRKTIPGLRYAQKYAVRCGGGMNHRMGLYDAFLIKENHIASCGSLSAAVITARTVNPEVQLEVEVENIEELKEALAAEANLILLDNFDLAMLRAAVSLNKGRARLEASGNINLENIREVAATGVDYISVGSLTKHVRAIDLSLRLS